MQKVRPYISKRLRKSNVTTEQQENSNVKQIEDEKSGSTQLSSQPSSESAFPETSSTCERKPVAVDYGNQTRNYVPRSCITKLKTHKNAVNRIKWTAVGDRLLSASMDSTIGVWDFSQGIAKQLRTICVHDGAVKDAKWDDTGKKILSGGYDQHARISDVDTGKDYKIKICCFLDFMVNKNIDAIKTR